MITLLLHLLRLLPVLFGGHRQLALENLALRQQLAVYKRMARRPRLRTIDRLFWVGLGRAWTGWREALVIVSPETVLRWQRRRFRAYWAKLSGRPTRGRPSINAEIASLVRKMAAANPLWGAPRIHGELLKLGIDVAERTVSRLMPKRCPQPSQTWRTFLANHVHDLVSIDFFAVQLFRRFLDTSARVTITEQEVTVYLPRRAHNPILLDAGLFGAPTAIPWWDGRPLRIEIV